MKKVLSLIVLAHIVATLPVVQAQTATEEPLTAAECSAEKYFSDNQCQVCYTANEEAKSDTKGFLLPASDIPWENTLDGINQNFYKSSQSVPEIKTNLGTAPATWDEKGLTWSTDVVWKDLDGLEMFSLDAGKTINIKSIEKDTLLPVNSIKDATSPYLVLKLPISYYELKMGTFKESAKKTTNYCISYTTKKVAGTTTSTNTATTNTNTTASNNTTTSTNPTTQNTTTNTNTTTASNTTTNNTTTNTTSNNTSTTNSDTADTNTTTEDTADTSTTTINDEIPSYDAKVTLNSAGTDPTASEASKIQTGPAENMLVLMAAILLSLALFPKVNTLLNK